MARIKGTLVLGVIVGLLAGSAVVEPATREVVNTDSTQTLSNKTLVSPVLQGNVGVGTTSPARKFHISGDAIALERPTGEVSLIDFRSDGVIRHQIGLDVNNKFTIFTGNRFVIDNSGNVGIGTITPQNALHVRSSGVQQLMLEGNSSWTQMGMKWSTNNFWTIGIGAAGANNFFILNQLGPAGYVLAIDPTGNICFACPGSYGTGQAIDTKTGAYLSQGGVWTNASSRALKQDIASLSSKEALQTLLELNPVTYRSKTDPQEQHIGFIAEEVPDLVATRDRKSLSPMDFVAVLTKVVQEQQKEIETLKAHMKTPNSLGRFRAAELARGRQTHQ